MKGKACLSPLWPVQMCRARRWTLCPQWSRISSHARHELQSQVKPEGSVLICGAKARLTLNRSLCRAQGAPHPSCCHGNPKAQLVINMHEQAMVMAPP